MADLSLLVCSIHPRTEKLARLLECLDSQPRAYLDRTQILVDIDDGCTIGAKRNRMIAAAKGRYVAFIDDDDLVTCDYLEHIFYGIDKGVDHVGVGMIYCNGRERTEVVCSMRNGWEKRDGKYLRPPQHVCAIRRSIAAKVRFPDVSFGEDKAFAETVRPLVHTEHLTPPIYLYLWEPKC
jgi:glycosyltransferase involved in cell wall biosynthesis